MKIATLASAVALLASVAAVDRVAAQTVVQADGSSTVFPVTEAMAEEFQKANSGIKVTVGMSGTGGGFKKFCRGETDISNASRPITAAEQKTCKEAGVEYIELPVALDAISVLILVWK
jgi:phosphate transport system substrate-binding protein